MRAAIDPMPLPKLLERLLVVRVSDKPSGPRSSARITDATAPRRSRQSPAKVAQLGNVEPSTPHPAMGKRHQDPDGDQVRVPLRRARWPIDERADAGVSLMHKVSSARKEAIG